VTALQYAINMQLGLDKTLGGPSLYWQSRLRCSTAGGGC